VVLKLYDDDDTKVCTWKLHTSKRTWANTDIIDKSRDRDSLTSKQISLNWLFEFVGSLRLDSYKFKITARQIETVSKTWHPIKSNHPRNHLPLLRIVPVMQLI